MLFEYVNDKQFFANIISDLEERGYIHNSELEAMINFRASFLELECFMADCDMPMWSEHYELLSSSKTDHPVYRLLVEYRCGCHENIYESIRL